MILYGRCSRMRVFSTVLALRRRFWSWIATGAARENAVIGPRTKFGAGAEIFNIRGDRSRVSIGADSHLDGHLQVFAHEGRIKSMIGSILAQARRFGRQTRWGSRSASECTSHGAWRSTTPIRIRWTRRSVLLRCKPSFVRAIRVSTRAFVRRRSLLEMTSGSAIAPWS